MIVVVHKQVKSKITSKQELKSAEKRGAELLKSNIWNYQDELEKLVVPVELIHLLYI